MNANKRALSLGLCALAFSCLISTGSSWAQTAAPTAQAAKPTDPAVAAKDPEPTPTAPALYGVQEMQIQHGRIVDAKSSGNCGISSGEASAMVMNAFKTDGLPAFSVLGAPEKNPKIARIDIFPDVTTIQPRDNECVSWVALTAQGREEAVVAPVGTPRDIIITYWNGGIMIATNKQGHPTAINDAFSKLTAQFSRQYRTDQPPALNPPAQAEKK